MQGPISELLGRAVRLELVDDTHAEALRSILATPEVWARWGDDELPADWPLDASDEPGYAIVHEGSVVGYVQYGEELEPKYRHASVDIFLSPEVHGRGLGRDTVSTMVTHLVHDRGHHRIVIDPAADNTPAIRCYSSVGFSAVGVMRAYERDADGAGWHDGLLMEFVADERSPGVPTTASDPS
jgi:RimJ/RimL family protein N-acetyltransferase